MVNICQNFASSRNLKFSTHTNPDKSKTKCIVFSKQIRDRVNVQPIKLNGDPLPWVSQVKHLGSILQQDNSMKIDLGQKRGKFIGKIMSLFQEFSFVQPSIFVKILNIFSTSFYGSGLWDILSAECERIYKSWNVSIRNAFNVDRCTHRYLIETISESLHPKVMLASRYVNFYTSLVSSSKLCVRVMARLFQEDQRTVLGRTLDALVNLCKTNLSLLTPNCIKKTLLYFPIPEDQEWRRQSVIELLQLRDKNLSLPGFTPQEVTTMLNFVCTS